MLLPLVIHHIRLRMSIRKDEVRSKYKGRGNQTLQRFINSTALSMSIADQSSSIEQIAKAQKVRRRSHSAETVSIGRGEKLMAR